MIRRMRWKKAATLLVVGTVLACGSWLVIRRSASADQGLPVVHVRRGSLELDVREVGLVAAMRKVDIKSKVAGQVVSVLVDVGERVKTGDALVQLDTIDAAHEVQRAVAEHRVAKAMLKQAREQLQVSEQGVALGALSRVELVRGVGDVARLEAKGAVSSASIAHAQRKLSDARLVSPIDGVVLSRNIEPGELVSPGVSHMVEGKPLLVVAQVERLLVRAELNQLDAASLTLNQPVEIRVDGFPGVVLEGRVYRMAAMGQTSERRPDSRLQVFPVDIVLDSAQPGAESVKPGMVADIRVHLRSVDNALLVPLEALVFEKGVSYVRRLGVGDAEELVRVDVGAQNSRDAQLTSGVAEGDRLRIRPADTEARNKR